VAEELPVGLPVDVRFGSLADILRCSSDVRFTPQSGHVQCNSVCPLCANSGHHCVRFTVAPKGQSIRKAQLFLCQCRIDRPQCCAHCCA
jgi:hypothetical protein